MGNILTTKKGTKVEIINCGNFYFDGGGIFGRVPKTMWEKWTPADDQNRILMATNILRVTKGSSIYLIDAGMGRIIDEKNWSIMGIGPQDIRVIKEPADYLICTHLHFDHIGGIHDLTIRSDIIVTSNEWTDARGEEEPLTKANYRDIDIDALEPFVCLVDPPYTPVDGIEIISTPGHTRGHASVVIDDEILYAGDLIPTSAHVHLPCIMAYDLYPMQSLKTKKSLLLDVCRKGMKIIFEHDPYRPWGNVGFSNNRFSVIESRQ